VPLSTGARVAKSRRASASGPEPHPNFIEVFCCAPVGDGHWTLAGAWEDGQQGSRLAARPPGWRRRDTGSKFTDSVALRSYRSSADRQTESGKSRQSSASRSKVSRSPARVLWRRRGRRSNSIGLKEASCARLISPKTPPNSTPRGEGAASRWEGCRLGPLPPFPEDHLPLRSSATLPTIEPDSGLIRAVEGKGLSRVREGALC